MMSKVLREDSENVSLVSRDTPILNSYTLEGTNNRTTNSDGGSGEGGGAGNDDNAIREMDYVDADVSVLSQFHEDALNQAGFGYFQWSLFLVVGIALAADAIEIYVIAYVIPSAEQELCMEDDHKGWLGAITFLGMMVGGLVWGSLADRLGRRRTLLSAMSTNAIFGIITAFMPTYGLLMVTRLCSGIGIGGTLPVVFTYYSEFLMKKHRGRHLSFLLTFWALGGIFVALMAWTIIPRTGVSIMASEGPHFSSWRIFLLVCALPSVASTVGLVFMPESPRFLLEVGRDVEAMFVYQNIFKCNHSRKPGPEYQLSELEVPFRREGNTSINNHRGLIAEILDALESFWSSFMQVIWPPYTRVTFKLLVIWLSTAFSFYGMSIWFPEYLKRLHSESYTVSTLDRSDYREEGRNINQSIENTHFFNVDFVGVSFIGMVLNHCVFENCTFFNVSFLDVRSSSTYFVTSSFTMVRFVDTDFYPYRFQECHLDNGTVLFLNTKSGCELDFDLNFKLSDVFLENMVAQLAIIPGNLLSSYLLDRLGRVKTMGVSLFLSGVSVLCMWFLGSKAGVVTFEAIFNFISISGWNAIDVITTESYPAKLRSTGYGFLSAMSRLAAVMGSLTFGTLMGMSKSMPIITSAAVLLVGSLFASRLKETKDVLM